MRLRSPALLLPVVLAGCTHDAGRYPSLAPRPVEKLSFDEPVRPHPVATPDVALEATIADHAAELTRTAAGFDAAASEAERDVARAEHQPVDSDLWLDAQGSLARLDDWRAKTSALTAAIEAMGSDRAARLAPAYAPLDALAARAAAESERETARVDALQRRLPAA